MNILADYVSFEENIKGSRFLSELFPCQNQTEARNLIKEQKSKYPDSTHVVHAFITGPGGEVMGMSDDGEPSGTAGRPALDVLKGHNCTNLLLTITRWFGGTLLGTGGLVKAYGNGAKKVLKAADEKNLFQPLVNKVDFSFSCDYSLYKLIKINFSNYNLFNLKEDFQSQINIKGQIQEDQKDSFIGKLTDISNGKIIVKLN